MQSTATYLAVGLPLEYLTAAGFLQTLFLVGLLQHKSIHKQNNCTAADVLLCHTVLVLSLSLSLSLSICPSEVSIVPK